MAKKSCRDEGAYGEDDETPRPEALCVGCGDAAFDTAKADNSCGRCGSSDWRLPCRHCGKVSCYCCPACGREVTEHAPGCAADPALPPVKCDKYRSGICSVAPGKTAMYCLRERAENCAPGECTHHPLFAFNEARPLLAEMKRAGVKLEKYGRKLLEPGFVDKLYGLFLSARSKRSTTSSKTSGLS